jgi:hypothetical protein
MENELGARLAAAGEDHEVRELQPRRKMKED